MATGTIKHYKNVVVYSKHDSSSRVTNSDGYYEGSFNVAQSGYTPIGIVGFDLRTTWVYPIIVHLSGNNVEYVVRAHGSAAGAFFHMFVEVLYISNS